MQRRTTRDQAGQVAGVEAVIFGLLVLVLGTLIIANGWAVVDAKMGAVSAAREAARAFVEAPDPTSAPGVARSAAAGSLQAAGRDPSRMSFSVSGVLARCHRVVVTVGLPVQLVGFALLGRTAGVVDVRGHSSEIVDPYRSGLGGTASCA